MSEIIQPGSREWRLPQDAALYIAESKKYFEQIQFSYESLIEPLGVGIQWAEITPPREGETRQTSERTLFLPPHLDDAEVTYGARLAKLARKTNNYVEGVAFTNWSGKARLGIPGVDSLPVRVAEQHKAAKVLKINRIGFMHFDYNSPAIPEAAWKMRDAKNPELAGQAMMMMPEWWVQHSAEVNPMIGVALLRKLNPHRLISPYPSIQTGRDVDTHTDHKLVATIANHAYEYGPMPNWVDWFPMPEGGIALQRWDRTALWSGDDNLVANSFTRYKEGSIVDNVKRQSIEPYVSQDKERYLQMARHRDGLIGSLKFKGDMAEPFDTLYRHPEVDDAEADADWSQD